MSEIDAISSARGLPAARKEAADALLHVFNEVNAARNAERRAYYEGDIDVKDIGVDAVPPDIRVHTSCDWPARAVDAVAERTVFTGFTFEDDARDEGLERVVDGNRLLTAFANHLPSELVHGCMAATVGRGPRGTIVRFHTAEDSAMTWDVARQSVGSGLVIADRRRTRWSKREPVPTAVNMYEPGLVTVFTRETQSRWRYDVRPTDMERPMMEAFAYKGTGDKPFGRSRITRNVIDIADEVVRIKRYMAFSGALGAAPQKYFLGLSEEQFLQLKNSKWSTYINSWILGTADEDGNAPTIGQLPQASALPYIEMLRQMASDFSSSTGIPMSMLVDHDNPASEAGILAQSEGLVSAAESLIASSKDSLREVALMAMAVEGNTTPDRLTDVQRSVQAAFKSPMRHSRAENADAALKLAQAIPGFGKTRVFLEMQDFDQGEIRRIQSDLRAVEAREQAASVMESFGSLFGGDDGEA